MTDHHDQPASVLVVDDEPLNIELLREWLFDAGYEVTAASDGEEALRTLRAMPGVFDAVLLDRMMPRLTGMATLQVMKGDPELAALPIIFQTARNAREDIDEGLRAGAMYYLCKPFDSATLLSVVRAAVDDHQRHRAMRAAAVRASVALSLLQQGTFHLQTAAEARELAAVLANATTTPEETAVALLELLLNGIEHGNLGITYDEKTKLIEEDRWHAEIARRLASPEHRDKVVRVDFTRNGDRGQLVIRDEGKGFDWRRYLEPSAERAFDSHGRGIAMARSIGFESLQYKGCGNEVEVVVALAPASVRAHTPALARPVSA